MTIFSVAFIIALLFFLLAILFKLQEKKFKLQKSQYVESFIKQKEINVSHILVGLQFDLIHDASQKMIWFCMFQKRKLQYKEMPYHLIHQVEWSIDRTPIQTYIKNRPLKVELITKKDHLHHEVRNEQVNEQYRVKESVLTITLDENPPQTLDLLLFSSNLPKSFKEVEKSDVAVWYDLFVSIIKKEEDNASPSAK